MPRRESPDLVDGRSENRIGALRGREGSIGGRASSDEVAATLHSEITRCATRATEHAMLLESIAAHSFTLTGEIFPDSRAPDLLQLSHRIRGIVLQGLGVLAELQCVAGRLDALASLRAADPSLEPRDI